ncbi:MAG TPA: hypothetical protein VFV10_16630 [Gammaproteobacteria bacterium]|nr:hypothetical protein [Gammaproteobacteria bacterium]
MPMQPESLEILEKADVPPAQARAIVRAIEIEIAGAKDTLSTKQDVLLLRQDVREGTSGLAQGLRGEMTELRQGLRGEMSELRQELRKEMFELRQELSQKMSDLAQKLRQETQEVRLELKREMSELRGELKAEIHATVSGVTRQMYMALLGQMAVLLGFIYFFTTHVAP